MLIRHVIIRCWSSACVYHLRHLYRLETNSHCLLSCLSEPGIRCWLLDHRFKPDQGSQNFWDEKLSIALPCPKCQHVKGPWWHTLWPSNKINRSQIDFSLSLPSVLKQWNRECLNCYADCLDDDKPKDLQCGSWGHRLLLLLFASWWLKARVLEY